MACMNGRDGRIQKGRLTGSQRSRPAVPWLLLPEGPVGLRHSCPSLSPYLTPPPSLIHQIVNQHAIDPFSSDMSYYPHVVRVIP